jgi:tRNA threonylcarbamoyladenosine biosynthesis protein TsaE
MRLRTSHPEETEAAGADLAHRLAPGDVVLVRGELGTGKTTFVRGACAALGVRDPVTSPTFTVGQLYGADRDGAQVEVAHLDLYRVASLATEDAGLLEDYLTSDRIAFVEWPGPAEPVLERVAARVTIEHGGGDRRMLEIA